jgi:hypothetical protein
MSMEVERRGWKALAFSRTRTRRACGYTALWLVGLTLWPALALACPPILQSVTVAPKQNHPTSTWTLPAGVTSQFMQTSRSSDVDEDGYFHQKDLVTFNTLAPSQTVFTDQHEFPEGLFYVHVAGHDKRCVTGVCEPIEFSDVMTFEVTDLPPPPPPATGASLSPEPFATGAALNCKEQGGGGPLPDTSGGPGPDKVAPFETLSFGAVQNIDKLFVRAKMSEAGTLRASATVSVAGASKVYRFKTVTKSVSANVSTKLRLKLSKKRLKTVKKALKKGKHLKAKVTVTARDKAKNKRSQKATIRLKR